MRFDCAQTEISFLRKRLAQLEQRLEAELGARTGLEQKASAASPGHWRGQRLPRATPRSRAEATCPLLASGQAKLCRAEPWKCGCLLVMLSKSAVFCWYENKYPKASFQLKKLLLHQDVAKFSLGQAQA